MGWLLFVVGFGHPAVWLLWLFYVFIHDCNSNCTRTHR
jgi:hypothetical protein